MDISKTEIKKIEWQGPFSWTGYENHNKEISKKNIDIAAKNLHIHRIFAVNNSYIHRIFSPNHGKIHLSI
jgi:hypothetical protein